MLTPRNSLTCKFASGQNHIFYQVYLWPNFDELGSGGGGLTSDRVVKSHEIVETQFVVPNDEFNLN